MLRRLQANKTPRSVAPKTTSTNIFTAEEDSTAAVAKFSLAVGLGVMGTERELEGCAIGEAFGVPGVLNSNLSSRSSANAVKRRGDVVRVEACGAVGSLVASSSEASR